MPSTTSTSRAAKPESLDAKLLLKTLISFKKGNFTARLPNDWTGVAGKIADTLNDVIEMNERLGERARAVSRVVGREGRSRNAQPPAPTAHGSVLIESVNTLIDDMAQPTTEMARVIGAVANGDLSQTMALEVDGRPLKGEFLRIGQTGQHDGRPAQLLRFGSDARGARSRHGRQARRPGEVKGVAGTWKDLTDTVNLDGRQPDRSGA